MSELTLPVVLVLGDFLVAWRAWVIWPFNRYVKAILIILMVLNIGMQIFISIFIIAPPDIFFFKFINYLVVTYSLSVPQFNILVDGVFGPQDIVGVAFSLIVNVSATFLIGLKAWLHRNELRKLGLKRNKFTSAQQVLLFWIESGFLFCVLQSLYVASGFIQDTVDVGDGSGGWAASMTEWLSILIPFIAGILPFSIFVIVHMKMSVVEETFYLQTVGLTQHDSIY
ncbi:hypothetical protein BDP27DRAFT_1424662 [Rhodocollybia butyracea]|uniref:Uncharacterized protein n=1 Tax=Rhodocollybia butyracea TaxID=206335 RepID=A0A9P5PLN2_9AGAR|nr:hypothetical protein BDP27DRAFT_1424662 [Rhodocollybia butyracea]